MSGTISDVYEKKVTCPNCRLEFATFKLRTTKLRMDKRESDYYISYLNEYNPLFYNPIICPKCGFASLEEKFLKSLLPVERKIINEAIANLKNRPEMKEGISIEESIRLYQYCFMVAQRLNNSYLLLAKISHRLGWHYRILKDEDKEMEYLTLARECYKSAYAKEDLQKCNMNELLLAYLVAELCYRTGEYKEAVNWFGRLISNREIKNQVGLENQAREQLHLAREALDRVK